MTVKRPQFSYSKSETVITLAIISFLFHLMLHQARPRRSRRMIIFSFRSIPRRCDAAGKGVPIFLSDLFSLAL